MKYSCVFSDHCIGVIITGLGGSGDGFGDGSGGLQIGDVSFTVIVAVCSAVAAFTIVLAGIVYHRLQRNTKARLQLF